MREHGAPPARGSGPLLVDCDDCAARGPACSDCVITVLLGEPTSGVRLEADERTALSALADSGLVPPLRLVPRYHTPPGLPLDPVRPAGPPPGLGERTG